MTMRQRLTPRLSGHPRRLSLERSRQALDAYRRAHYQPTAQDREAVARVWATGEPVYTPPATALYPVPRCPVTHAPEGRH